MKNVIVDPVMVSKSKIDDPLLVNRTIHPKDVEIWRIVAQTQFLIASAEFSGQPSAHNWSALLKGMQSLQFAHELQSNDTFNRRMDMSLQLWDDIVEYYYQWGGC